MDEKRWALDLLDSDLANQVRSVKDAVRLRLFACECASLALAYCTARDPRSLNAVDLARLYAKGRASDAELDDAYTSAEKAAKAADEVAFDMRDAFEESRAAEEEYTEAFAAARAAFSARDCCQRSSIEAANNAGYEAWAALSTIVENRGWLPGLLSVDVSGTDIDAAIVTVLRDVLRKSEKN
jgi:hypothetical protein